MDAEPRRPGPLLTGLLILGFIVAVNAGIVAVSDVLLATDEFTAGRNLEAGILIAINLLVFAALWIPDRSRN